MLTERMRKKNRAAQVILGVFFALTFMPAQCVDANEHAGRGLKPLAEDEVQHIEKHWPKVVEVKPNKFGRLRIQKHLHEQGELQHKFKIAHTIEEEIITDQSKPTSNKKGSKSRRADGIAVNPPLPRAVNNSTLPSFPPIGDQGQHGSCVAWASTYYQATHEIGLLNGYNNKLNFVNVLSPKWTYNLLNNGQDQGLNILNAYQLLAQNGATTIINLPYDGNYLLWDLNLQDWLSAISNRMLPAHLVAGVNTKPQNLAPIKQLLSNGHVLTFGTYIDSWAFTTVGRDPTSQNNAHVGEMVASYVQGYSGGHCMTIVGYDDDVWVDINGNGQVDPGEKGAFLVANSWSTGWGNAGFVWIAYDAFLSTSAVKGGPQAGRVPAADAMNSYLVTAVPKAANYVPSIIAEFTLTQSVRNQIALSAGVADTSKKVPVKTFADTALTNQGGVFEFNGTASSGTEQVSFALDLTDLYSMANVPSKELRFFLLVSDNSKGNPTVLNSFTLVDNVHKTTKACSSLPLTCDNASIAPYVDYALQAQPMADTIPPVVNITSPVKGTVVKGVTEIIVSATDNVAVARVELYIDSVLVATDKTAPYIFSVDTSILKLGTHQLTAIAYDTSNNAAHVSSTMTVKH